MKITQRIIDQARMIAEAKVGQELECYTHAGREWSADFCCVYFDNGNMVYRIKPEPRTIWVNSYPNDSGRFYGHASREQAIAKGTCLHGEGHPDGSHIAIEYREVVE